MADDDLETYLESLPDKLEGQLSDVIREQAQRLSDAQKDALRSLEQSHKTGDLEESCTVVPGDHELEWIVQAGGDLTTKEIRDGSGQPYDYAEAFEFGTSRQPAHAFFFPTYNAMRDEMQQAIDQAVNEVLSND